MRSCGFSHSQADLGAPRDCSTASLGLGRTGLPVMLPQHPRGITPDFPPDGTSLFFHNLQFHLENAKKRAQQRLREGRARAIDVLAANLHLMEEFDANVTTPYSVFNGLSLAETRELGDDIKGYQVLPHLALCSCRHACTGWS